MVSISVTSHCRTSSSHCSILHIFINLSSLPSHKKMNQEPFSRPVIGWSKTILCSHWLKMTPCQCLPVTKSFSLGLKTNASTEPSWNLSDLLWEIKLYSRLTKNAMIQGSIIEGEGDFGATFVVKIGQFTCCSVAS